MHTHKYVIRNQHTDLINAVDVVLGKVGYGTCSEVVAHSKPFIYVSRPLFIEEPGIIANLLEPHGRAVEMPLKDFKAGLWGEAIHRAMALPLPTKTISMDGHKDVCRLLLKYFESLVPENKS